MPQKPLHIFIAEDDPLLRRFYAQAFKLRGYTTEMAVDGEDAMEKIELLKRKPDLFLLDIMMPKLDGIAVLRGIKEDARYNKVPVIMLTNLSGRQNEGEAAIALGASAYLLKSEGDLAELFENIERVAA